jgi:hypothetical protein|tara:strand:+ start:344 stop:502 length:159 start_codon:yes stop_codon:yes gene_type:complete
MITNERDRLHQGVVTLKSGASCEIIKAFVFILAKNTITNRKLKQIDKLIYEL